MAKRSAVSNEHLKEISTSIIDAFKDRTLPEALSQIFIHRDIDVASQTWSFTNRLIGIKKGHVYAAGAKQWQSLGRWIKKGERAFRILGPRFVTVPQDAEGNALEENESICLGSQFSWTRMG